MGVISVMTVMGVISVMTVMGVISVMGVIDRNGCIMTVITVMTKCNGCDHIAT